MNKGVHYDRIFSRVAEAALVGARFVKAGTIDNGVVPCGADEQATGVAPYDAAINTVATVVNSGVVEVDCAGVIPINGYVKSDADGKAVAAVAADIACGIAQELGAANAKLRIQLLTDSLSLAP